MPGLNPSLAQVAFRIAKPSIEMVLGQDKFIFLAILGRNMEHPAETAVGHNVADRHSLAHARARTLSTVDACLREGLPSDQLERKPWLDRNGVDFVAGASEDTGFATAAGGATDEINDFAARILWIAVAYVCSPDVRLPNV